MEFSRFVEEEARPILQAFLAILRKL